MENVEELVQTFDFQIDYAVAQHKSEAFINVQYGTTFPANGTQLQGATYLEQSAGPRTHTDVDDNVSQKAMHPGKNDNRDTRMRNESEDRQEYHNIGWGTNDPNEGNHTDDTDKSIIWISKLGRPACPKASTDLQESMTSDEEGSIQKINKKQTQDYGISYFGRNSSRQRRDYSPEQTSEDYVKSNYNRRSGRPPDYGRLWQNCEETKSSTKGFKSTGNYR